MHNATKPTLIGSDSTKFFIVQAYPV